MSPETGPPEPVTTPPAPAPAAPPEPSPEQIQAATRAYLKEKHGIEDPDEELTALRTRARQADELERALRTAQRPPPSPAAPPPAAPVISREEWAEIEQLGRINPVAAYARIDAYKEAAREQREAERARQQQAQTLAMISASQVYHESAAEAEAYVKREYPDVYDKRTALYREGQRVYDAMPELQRRGDGFKLAAQIAASNLGQLPKSKRADAVTRDTDDQAPERGTRRPTAEPDEGPALTDKQRKRALDAGVDPKVYQKHLATRQAEKKGARA